ncbi:MAG: nucleotidyltransferase [Clostridiaceae bacterium]|nr:nucleotidyltransferase [Clostridiaceae bacterium]
MGGSGGFFGSTVEPGKLARHVREAEEKSQDQQYVTDVNKLISDLLVAANSRDSQAVQRHLDTIKEALSKYIEGTVDTIFGGSVSKHTYVEGLSDIDTLVLLNNSELSDLSPKEAKAYFVERLRERLPNTEIVEGNLAVTVKFTDIDVQLLPTIKHNNGYKIPDANGKEWSHINPTEFTSELSSINKECGGKLIPTIKVAKVIISNLPEERRLTGYHVEALATEIFKEYRGELTPKAMVEHFFTKAADSVLTPIKERTGQSSHVDDYLGAKDSLERNIIASNIGRVARRMANANGARSADLWKKIIED